MSSPNILLVTIDSLRADHVYGAHAKTPTMDRIREEGVAYTSAFAQGPFTTFSMPSLFTSRYPSQLTNIDFVEDVDGVLVDGAPTIQERLKAVGYTTAGIHSNPLLSELFGFDVGFDYFEDGLDGFPNRLPGRLELLVNKIRRLVRRHAYVPAEDITDQAIDWLEDIDEQPVFLWVHYMDVHGPYQSRDSFSYLEKFRSEWLWRKAVHSPKTVTEAERERLRAAYVEEVEYVDAHIGRLLDAFEDTLPGEAFIALTADHGDEFFEHGSFSHESKLYDELIHVPLVMRPGGTAEILEDTVDEIVSLLDVGPTLVDAGGGDIDGFQGEVLFGHSKSPRKAGDAFGGYAISEAQFDPAYVGAVRTDRWKYIDAGGKSELYDLSTDSEESTNVVESNPDVAASLEDLLEEHRERAAGQRREDEVFDSRKLDDRLRRLGYLE